MRIASVEDDPDQAELIRQILGEAGFECESFATGAAFLRALRERAFDLLLVDWQLPGTSGYEVVSWVRQKSGNMPPILFLTSRTQEEDIVAGLAVGADDYMLKPIRAGELMARVRSLLRRAYPEAAQQLDIIRCGNYVVDPRLRTVTVGGQPAEISPREYELALFLFRNIGPTCTAAMAMVRHHPRTCSRGSARMRAGPCRWRTISSAWRVPNRNT
jgi:DNA-binding response OmpR family regulator